jgi:hypothetical protein
MGRPAPVVERDDDDEQRRLNAYNAYCAARRARLIEQELGTGVYPVDMFSAKRKAR